MRDKEGYWHALPREIAQWWTQELSEVSLHEGKIYITPQSNSQA
jgi:hypothetical protein